MRGFGIACAVVAALLMAVGCNDYGNTFQVPTGAQISSLSPATVTAGSTGFTLTVNGNFTSVSAKTVVQWNNTTIPTTVATDSAGTITGVTATVAASLVVKQGTAFVNTLSPHSGTGTNGLSNVLAFIINPPPNPVPVVNSISPTTAAAGSPVTLTITGSSFLPTSDPSGGSQVHWVAGASQSTLTASSITSTQIQATVGTSLICGTSATVSVFNPPSSQNAPTGAVPNPGAGGGGPSANSPTFTISGGTACPQSATATAQSSVAQETPALNADGRYVAYSATQGDHSQVFVRDTCEGAAASCQPRTMLVSSAGDGAEGNDDSRSPSMSSDGRYIGFSSAATNLIADAASGRQVYVRDTCFGTASESCTPSTQLVSTDPNGKLVGTESILPSVSASGRFVAFLAETPSHAAGKTSSPSKSAVSVTNSGYRQVFVRDTCAGATGCTPKTTRISLHPGDTSTVGQPSPNDTKPAGPAVSGAGKHVAVPDAGTATIFTHGVAVDDRVFLALTSQQQ